ncbi:zinc finger protein 70 isoform X16 [Cryptotermes secundus]|uniref:zinc finger protein 70 isoform X16 n=1 Tax=Cryptotermes secundus TaxID=105785 RepID=UPI001454D272|nr:zinc finger protein 70 isoform X16 [Cryptotermes secundus]
MLYTVHMKITGITRVVCHVGAFVCFRERRSEESSEEQLKTFHQSMEDSTLVSCRNNDNEHIILTPQIEFDSLSTCDNLSAYEVFNLPTYEALGLCESFPDKQSTVMFVKDEDIMDEDGPDDEFQSVDEQVVSGYPYVRSSDMLLGSCVIDHSYYVDVEGYYYNVKGRQVQTKKTSHHDKHHCQHCGKTFFTAVSFRHHLKVDHTELNELRCISCNDTFESISDLQFHKSVHSRNSVSDGPYLCSICGKTFGILSTLRSHERRVHKSHENSTEASDMKHTCAECGKEFQFQEYLKRHMMKHGEKNFVCETCGKKFETLYILKLHQESHSDVRPYVCKICGSSYKRYRNLLSHRQYVHGLYAIGPRKPKDPLKPHNKPKNALLKRFSCDVCNKAFSTRGKVAVHMRTHTGERPCHCDICGNTYPYSSSLYVHRKVVHEGRQRAEKGTFSCVVCDKTFSTRNYLDVHRRTHTGEKPFVCTVCSRAFSQRTSLINHIALHTDSRPYDCTFCNKAFRRRETLLVHIRTHTGEKPYVCEICSRGFAQLTDMKKHRLKIHNAPPLKRR